MLKPNIKCKTTPFYLDKEWSFILINKTYKKHTLILMSGIIIVK